MESVQATLLRPETPTVVVKLRGMAVLYQVPAESPLREPEGLEESSFSVAVAKALASPAPLVAWHVQVLTPLALSEAGMVAVEAAMLYTSELFELEQLMLAMPEGPDVVPTAREAGLEIQLVLLAGRATVGVVVSTLKVWGVVVALSAVPVSPLVATQLMALAPWAVVGTL